MNQLLSQLCTSQIEASTSSPGDRQAFEFLENVCSNTPSLGRKAVQMPHQMPLPQGKLPDYCFYFSVISIMLLKLCM